ncbi:MAG TPA: hypothetical protein VK212_04875 [Lentimicrobium sp.]|nr:hypothetical protein [Lentimicrobium sp.]
MIFEACKKEKNQFDEPEVKILSPSEGEVFKIYDTVFIKARVQHSRNILKATLSITDTDLKRIEGGPTLFPDTTVFTIDTYIILSNRYVQETENYLLIEIEDDNEAFNFWYNLRIVPLDKELQNILVITGAPDNPGIIHQSHFTADMTGNLNRLYKISSSGTYSKINEWTSEFIGGYTDSKFRLFYSSGSIESGISGFDIEQNITRWNVPAQSAGSIPYFTTFDGYEGKVAVGIYDGSVECYDQNGIILMKTVKQPGGRFSTIRIFDKWVVGVFNPFDGTNAKLYIFNNPAGNLYDIMNLPGKSAKLIPLDLKQMLVIVDESGNNEAYTYNFVQKQFNYLHEVTSDPLYRSTGLGNDIFFISEGGVKWYRANIGSTVDYLQIDSVNSIAYDAVGSTLFVGRGNILYSYSLPLTTPSSSIAFPEEIKEISLLYNK